MEKGRGGLYRGKKGEREMERGRGGEKGVPPHSTTHFNHCMYVFMCEYKDIFNINKNVSTLENFTIEGNKNKKQIQSRNLNHTKRSSVRSSF